MRCGARNRREKRRVARRELGRGRRKHAGTPNCPCDAEVEVFCHFDSANTPLDYIRRMVTQHNTTLGWIAPVMSLLLLPSIQTRTSTMTGGVLSLVSRPAWGAPALIDHLTAVRVTEAADRTRVLHPMDAVRGCSSCCWFAMDAEHLGQFPMPCMIFSWRRPRAQKRE
jgi:hypothetical protein